MTEYIDLSRGIEVLDNENIKLKLAHVPESDIITLAFTIRLNRFVRERFKAEVAKIESQYGIPVEMKEDRGIWASTLIYRIASTKNAIEIIATALSTYIKRLKKESFFG